MTLALALRASPVTAGGLLFIQALALGLMSPEAIHTEVEKNMGIIFLIIFVVTGVALLKDFLSFLFSKLIMSVKSETGRSLLFLLLSAILSAVQDALTVTAVVITVFSGLYAAYHRYESKIGEGHAHDPSDDSRIHRNEVLEQFRSWARKLLMYSAIGTMLGGITTLIGEPQNLLIGEVMGWNFVEFFVVMAPVSLPVLCLVHSLVLRLRSWDT